MPNRAFRLLLSLSSVYVACMTYFNVVIGSYRTGVDMALIATSVLSLLQVVNLISLYYYRSKMIRVAYGSEGLLVISSLISLVTFHYLTSELIFGLVITLLTIGLIYCAQRELKNHVWRE